MKSFPSKRKNVLLYFISSLLVSSPLLSIFNILHLLFLQVPIPKFSMSDIFMSLRGVSTTKSCPRQIRLGHDFADARNDTRFYRLKPELQNIFSFSFLAFSFVYSCAATPAEISLISCVIFCWRM